MRLARVLLLRRAVADVAARDDQARPLVLGDRALERGGDRLGIVSDGDLMEGVASESASLAGHWGLGNLVYLWDDNRITLDGDASWTFSEDVARRFEALGWHVQSAGAYDLEGLDRAIQAAVAETSRPSLIATRSHIGYGAPKKQDTHAAHGEPLGADEARAAKRALGWPEQPTFSVPDEVRALFAERAAALRPGYEAWQRGLEAWRRRDPEAASRWEAMRTRRVPADALERLLAEAPAAAGATRAHGAVVLQKAAAMAPSLVGGAADLESSTRTRIADSTPIRRGDYAGRHIQFGVREHGMGAILNGLAAHGAFIPFGSSFLVFTDYCRPAIRLSALMKLQVIWVFTHDSVFLGEDGPTHEPIEHLAALRAIPDLLVLRPADGPETAGAWGLALERREAPTLLALTRQNLPALERARPLDAATMRRGGYVLDDAAGAGVTIVATGSEVWLAREAAQRMAAAGTPARVVSMPAPQLFLEQDAGWRDAVLPRGGRVVSLEAASTFGWHRVVGERGLCVGIDRFGESAPLAEMQEHFGFTPEKVARRVLDWLRSS